MVPHTVDSFSESRQQTLVVWGVLLALLVGAFATTVLVLNGTVFSAGGFVGSYLGALERNDVVAALATAGVRESPSLGGELLSPPALASLDDIRVVSDLDQGDGFHTVTAVFELDGTPARSTFEVQSSGYRFGLFSTWSFLQSPTAVLMVTPLHDPSFSVNDVDLVSRAEPATPVSFQVLVPGRFVLDHESAFLEASAVDVVVTTPGSTNRATVDVQAGEAFVAQIQDEVDDVLDDCVTQTVLFPTGCPFGQALANRLESTPDWSMVRYPEVTIEPGPDPGTWVVSDARGIAHLRVEVRSLFDGTVSTFDQDVPFTLNWVMTINDGSVGIRAR